MNQATQRRRQSSHLSSRQRLCAPSREVRALRSLETVLAGATDLQCLAVAIYHEARDQSLDGQLAVASVILNRAREPKRWGARPCDIVVPGQFSFLSPLGVTSIQFLAGSALGAAYDDAVLVGDYNSQQLLLLRLNASRDGCRWITSRMTSIICVRPSIA